jgi:hypothetical protein
MNTLTVPKIKDLVHKPSEQYKDIFDTMQKGTMQKGTMQKGTMQKGTMQNKNTLEDSSAMTDELTQFFNDLKKTSTVTNSTLATNANPLNTTNTNNKSEPLGEPLTSSNSSNSSSTTYSPY